MPNSDLKPVPSKLPVTLEGWLRHIESLHPKSIAMGLGRVEQVKQRLQLDPVFPMITVAGTNGKGSTCAMLESIYLQAGYTVGCYTSPHLLRYNERVRVNGIEADDTALCSAFAAVEAAREDTELTYFESGTLAALWYFTQMPVDVAILEVGLGGRLDAVNAFQPACTIVTSVDLDHMDFLGNDRASIGYEKAGIFRKDTAAICGDANPPETMMAYAREIGAEFKQIGQDFGFEQSSAGWSFYANTLQHNALKVLDLPSPSLTGYFQLTNASCAIAAVTVLQSQLPVKPLHLATGLKKMKLAGRFQMVGSRPQTILDVAHNPQAARSLAENLRNTRCEGRTFAVFAMLADKDIAGVIQAVKPQIDAWYVAGIEHARGTTSVEIAEQLKLMMPAERSIKTFADIVSAYRQACKEASENDRIIVFGSFFTVADVMRMLGDEN